MLSLLCSPLVFSVCLTLNKVTTLRVNTLSSLDIKWRWKVVGNKVEYLFYNHTTSVTTSNEEEVTSKNTLTECSLELFDGNRFFTFFKVPFE